MVFSIQNPIKVHALHFSWYNPLVFLNLEYSPFITLTLTFWRVQDSCLIECLTFLTCLIVSSWLTSRWTIFQEQRWWLRHQRRRQVMPLCPHPLGEGSSTIWFKLRPSSLSIVTVQMLSLRSNMWGKPLTTVCMSHAPITCSMALASSDDPCWIRRFGIIKCWFFPYSHSFYTY